MNPAAHTRTATPLTVEQMQDAYQLLRKADWPPLHDLMLQVQRWKLIEGLAQRRARGERTQTPALLTPAAPQHSATAQATHHAPPLPHHPPQLDFKSRAAGERDDN